MRDRSPEARSSARWERRRSGRSQANRLQIEYYFTHFAEGWGWPVPLDHPSRTPCARQSGSGVSPLGLRSFAEEVEPGQFPLCAEV